VARASWGRRRFKGRAILSVFGLCGAQMTKRSGRAGGLGVGEQRFVAKVGLAGVSALALGCNSAPDQEKVAALADTLAANARKLAQFYRAWAAQGGAR